MRTTKKLVAALAVVAIASLGVAAPSGAAAPSQTRVNGNWCC